MDFCKKFQIQHSPCEWWALISLVDAAVHLHLHVLLPDNANKLAILFCYTTENSAPPVFLPTDSASYIIGELLRNNCDVSLFSPQHVEGPECQLHRQLRIHAFTSCVTQWAQVRLNVGVFVSLCRSRFLYRCFRLKAPKANRSCTGAVSWGDCRLFFFCSQICWDIYDKSNAQVISNKWLKLAGCVATNCFTKKSASPSVKTKLKKVRGPILCEIHFTVMFYVFSLF